MKIAIVVYRLDPNRGGAERWTSDYVDWLRKRHSVTLLTARENHNLQNLSGISQRVFSSRDRFEFARRVSHEVDKSNFDVVHDMGYGFNSDVFQPHSGSQIAMDRSKSELHSALPNLGRQLLKFFSRRQQRLTALANQQFQQTHTHFVAVSRRVSNDLQQLHTIPLSRISIVHNSVDTVRFHPDLRYHFRRQLRHDLQIGENEFMLLTVAHNHRLKGVPALLKLAQA
ncbi:MAG: glycosyltransferase, partial [Aureliella sp.]